MIESVGKAGLYLSTDGGATWENITEELPNRGYLQRRDRPWPGRGTVRRYRSRTLQVGAVESSSPG